MNLSYVSTSSRPTWWSDVSWDTVRPLSWRAKRKGVPGNASASTASTTTRWSTSSMRGSRSKAVVPPSSTSTLDGNAQRPCSSSDLLPENWSIQMSVQESSRVGEATHLRVRWRSCVRRSRDIRESSRKEKPVHLKEIAAGIIGWGKASRAKKGRGFNSECHCQVRAAQERRHTAPAPGESG